MVLNASRAIPWFIKHVLYITEYYLFKLVTRFSSGPRPWSHFVHSRWTGSVYCSIELLTIQQTLRRCNPDLYLFSLTKTLIIFPACFKDIDRSAVSWKATQKAKTLISPVNFQPSDNHCLFFFFFLFCFQIEIKETDLIWVKGVSIPLHRNLADASEPYGFICVAPFTIWTLHAWWSAQGRLVRLCRWKDNGLLNKTTQSAKDVHTDLAKCATTPYLWRWKIKANKQKKAIQRREGGGGKSTLKKIAHLGNNEKMSKPKRDLSLQTYKWSYVNSWD